MEDIKKLLQQSDIDVDSSESDSDVSFEIKHVAAKKTSTNASSSSKRKGNGAARLPTRRPDPNVYNRNALLARENRRKKKEYLEAIENELEEVRNTNRSLIKALKKQYKVTRGLEKEKQYFKNILANHDEIKNLINVLNIRNFTPNPSCVSPVASLSSTYCSSRSSCCEPEATNNFDGSENDYEQSNMYDNTWKELLEEDCFGLTQPNPSFESGDNDNVINRDHSYVKDSVSTTSSTNSTEDSMGVCLHVTGGKFSLEFCPSCHWNANRTPPSQLLQDNNLIGQSI